MIGAYKLFLTNKSVRTLFVWVHQNCVRQGAVLWSMQLCVKCLAGEKEFNLKKIVCCGPMFADDIAIFANTDAKENDILQDIATLALS